MFKDIIKDFVNGNAKVEKINSALMDYLADNPSLFFKAAAIVEARKHPNNAFLIQLRTDADDVEISDATVAAASSIITKAKEDNRIISIKLALTKSGIKLSEADEETVIDKFSKRS